jgi:cytochrome c oxidase subunit 2
MSKHTARIAGWSMTFALAIGAAFPMVAARPVAQPTVQAEAKQSPAPKTAPVVIKVSAKKYEFTPSKIQVEQGKPVRLEITATDHDHGFEIKDLSTKEKELKISIKEGKTEVLEFTPDKVGEFEFKCSTFCGLGHGGMKGKLVVTAPKG